MIIFNHLIAPTCQLTGNGNLNTAKRYKPTHHRKFVYRTSYVRKKKKKEKGNKPATTKPLLGETSAKLISWTVKSLYFLGEALIFVPIQGD